MNLSERLARWSEEQSAVRILVIDDHPLFRKGVAAHLEDEPGIDLVGEAASPAEGIRRAGETQPDVILLDLHMPGVDPSATIAALREAAPETRVVMLTVVQDAEDLTACLRAGAAGYLVKNIDGEYLVDAVRKVARGERAVSAPAAIGDSANEPAAAVVSPRRSRLSPREREILTLVAQGSTNKEVARVLGVAESTVKIHVQHILRKLGLTSRVQAAVYAAENRLM